MLLKLLPSPPLELGLYTCQHWHTFCAKAIALYALFKEIFFLSNRIVILPSLDVIIYLLRSSPRPPYKNKKQNLQQTEKVKDVAITKICIL